MAGDPDAGVVRCVPVHGYLLTERCAADAEDLNCLYASEIPAGLHLPATRATAQSPSVHCHTGTFTLTENATFAEKCASKPPTQNNEMLLSSSSETTAASQKYQFSLSIN